MTLLVRVGVLLRVAVRVRDIVSDARGVLVLVLVTLRGVTVAPALALA